MRPARRRWTWLALIALLMVALVGAGAVSCSPARVIEAAHVMQDVAAGAAPSALKANTPTPSRRSIAYRIEDRVYEGDVYTPAHARPEAALLLMPGVSPRGRDDPRLVAFASTLARARFLVLVPELPGLRQTRVGPSDIVAIMDALRHLDNETEKPVGVVAFSWASGPVLIAMLQSDVTKSVHFGLLIGGYYDIEALVTFVTTGAFRADRAAPWQFAEPNTLGKWLFLLSNIDRIENERDRALLREIGERKFDDPGAAIADLQVRLGPEGRAIDEFLGNRDPDLVPALSAKLPQGIRADMAALDPSTRDLSMLGARFYLIHGQNDSVIPYTESTALAKELPNATLFQIDSLAHVDLGPSSWLDALSLWRATYLLLSERKAD